MQTPDDGGSSSQNIWEVVRNLNENSTFVHKSAHIYDGGKFGDDVFRGA